MDTSRLIVYLKCSLNNRADTVLSQPAITLAFHLVFALTVVATFMSLYHGVGRGIPILLVLQFTTRGLSVSGEMCM